MDQEKKPGQQNQENHKLARQLIKCIDLTCLNDQATEQDNKSLCQQAITANENVAAICIWSNFIISAKKWLGQYAAKNNIHKNIHSIATEEDASEDTLNDNSANDNAGNYNSEQKQLPLIATVINFPHGNHELDVTKREIDNALKLGADELDIVMPYKMILNNEIESCHDFLQQCINHSRQEAMDHGLKPATIKIIIESGELKNTDNIEIASKMSLDSGADFIKTSTGKTKNGASLAAVETMAKEIKKYHQKTGEQKGIKISGGVASFEDAKQYYQMVCRIWHKKTLEPNIFRIGASRLLQDLIDR